MAGLSFARGMFDKAGGACAGAGGARRSRPDTLCELRWHQPLPTDGDTARAVSAAICNKVLPTLPPVPARDYDEAQRGAEDFMRLQTDELGAPRFVDVKTGMRLRYLRWGGAHKRTVLLLHDLGDCAGVLSGLARSLASRGYCVYALDWRGHGDSTRSADARYDTAALADDLESFVLELDLYVAPLALVGFGLGAAVAARFAAAHPALVAGAALCELWAEPPADAGFHPGQAARFASPAQAAAFLCADCWGHPPRPLAAVVRHNAWRLRICTDGSLPSTVMKLDARFHCTRECAAALRGWLADAKCHVALLFGQRSHVGTAALRSAAGLPDATRPARESAALLDHARQAASTALLPLPAGHFLLEDAPLALRDALVACLGRWAAAGALDAQGPRAPELLGLRPLPQFESMDDARKALRPRAVPTRAVVDAALAELRGDGGAASSDEDEEVRRGTMLSHQPRNYFGFVG